MLWPRGQREPGHHSSGSGLSLSVISACVGCKASVTCPYFATFRRYAKRIGISCPTTPPSGEIAHSLNKDLVAFVDPSFVAGAGWPSGHGQRASGLIGIESGPAKAVFTTSCTLPNTQRPVCADSAGAERRLFP